VGRDKPTCIVLTKYGPGQPALPSLLTKGKTFAYKLQWSYAKCLYIETLQIISDFDKFSIIQNDFKKKKSQTTYKYN